MTKSDFSRRALFKYAASTAATGAVLGMGLNAGLTTSAIASDLSDLPEGNHKTIYWKMVTSWPKNSPGLGVTAQRLADRIRKMSDGRLIIKLYAAGELVPPLEVFDAVSGSRAEMAHTASFFWQGKTHKQSLFFTTIPFGMSPTEHMSWICHGGGQELWDEIYAPFGIKAFMAGNTGTQMGGWFHREINKPEDLVGLKIRAAGLGGEIYKKLGATPIFLPPPEIYGGLQTGVVDAVEFLGPWIDQAFGFHRAAPFYYGPGFNKPNGTAECLINKTAYMTLPQDLQEIVASACATENAFSLIEAEYENARVLNELHHKYMVKMRQFPDSILQAAFTAYQDVLHETFERDLLGQKILYSYQDYLNKAQEWRKLGQCDYKMADHMNFE